MPEVFGLILDYDSGFVFSEFSRDFVTAVMKESGASKRFVEFRVVVDVSYTESTCYVL